MGLKCDPMRKSHCEFCYGGPVSNNSKIQNLYLAWLRHLDNSYFSCFCRFSNHRSMGQIKFFPLLRCFSFANFSMIPSFICSWIILPYSPSLFDRIKFLLSYVIYQDYSLHYFVIKDDFLSR